MSSSTDDHAKKRRIDDGGAASSTEGVSRDGGLAPELMSVLNKLLDQNRSMENKLDRMEGEVKSLRDEVKSMRGEEIKNMQDKCDALRSR